MSQQTLTIALRKLTGLPPSKLATAGMEQTFFMSADDEVGAGGAHPMMGALPPPPAPVDPCDLEAQAVELLGDELRDALTDVCCTLEASRHLWTCYSQMVKAFMNSSFDDGALMVPAVVDMAIRVLKNARSTRKICVLPAGWKTVNTDVTCKAWYFLALVVEPEADRPGAAAGDDGAASFTVAVCNGGGEGMHWHPSKASQPHKIQYRGSVRLPGIRAERLIDEGFWTMAFGMSGHLSNYPAKQARNMAFCFYDTLLPWLCEQSLEDTLVQGLESEDADLAKRVAAAGEAEGEEGARLKPPSPWRSPMYSETSHFRSLLEALRCMLTSLGLSARQLKIATFHLRATMIDMAIDDLQCVRAVDADDVHLLEMATQQLALAAVKTSDDHGLQLETLRSTLRQRVDGVRALYASKPQLGSGESKSFVSLSNTDPASEEHVLHPFFERVVFQDVAGKEKEGVPLPKQLPVDLYALPKRVTNPEEAMAVLRHTEILCLQLTNLEQHGSVKHSSFLKLSLLTTVFTAIVPVPPPKGHKRAFRHAWTFDETNMIAYGQQVEMLLLLGRLTQHFVAASYSTRLTKAFDAQRLVTLGAITVLADHLLRQRKACRSVSCSNLHPSDSLLPLAPSPVLGWCRLL